MTGSGGQLRVPPGSTGDLELKTCSLPGPHSLSSPLNRSAASPGAWSRKGLRGLASRPQHVSWPTPPHGLLESPNAATQARPGAVGCPRHLAWLPGRGPASPPGLDRLDDGTELRQAGRGWPGQAVDIPAAVLCTRPKCGPLPVLQQPRQSPKSWPMLTGPSSAWGSAGGTGS